jgi:DNA-binding NarL/FixJ family response regulator
VDTVLIVDDSIMLINYLRDFFKRYVDKFAFVTANNGQEAIEILKDRPISLLVTDLEMPKVDGLRLLAYTNEHHPSIPCIVMSAHGTPKIIETLQPDIIQFIEKPFTAEELAQAIMSALKRGLPDGSLSGISIASFLTMIQLEQKTCLCEVESPNNLKGFFYFKGGELYHAVCAGLKGAAAAIKMIQIEDATISFRKPPDREIPRGIKADLTALILEAVRLTDES